MVVKFWHDPVALERAAGFSRRELDATAKLVQQNADQFLEKWYEFFGR